jgi:octaprenyl-diphosphate synthase
MNPELAPSIRPTSVWYAPIARDMDAAERIFREKIDRKEPGVAKLLQHLSHYRGKRLRPALLLLTARACGNVAQEHHVLAAVVEMIHTATLVHDDVLDGATVRRHVPTIHSQWGNQASILLGDFLFTHAFHLSSTLDDVRACRIIGETTNRLCAGELHQVCEKGNLDLTEDEYIDIIYGKTAELTSCCGRLGALYAGADSEVVENMARYGSYLGLAFQISDDLLDLVGEEGRAGKSLGTDLDQNKLTLPLIHYMSRATPVQAERVRHILRSAENHKRENLRPELEACGAIAYSLARAREYATLAVSQLDCLPASECRWILESLAERVVSRDC